MIKAVVFDAYGTLYDVQSVAAATEAALALAPASAAMVS